MPDHESLEKLKAFLAICLAALSFLFFGYAVKRVSAFEETVFKAVEPMINPVWVYLFTGEKPGLLALTGAVLILVTVLGRNLIVIRRRPGSSSLRKPG